MKIKFIKLLITVCVLLLVFPQLVLGELFFSLEYKEEVNVIDYYPLAVGNKWIYQNEHKSAVDSIDKIYKITWDSEITIMEHVNIFDGLFIVRDLKIHNVQFEFPDGLKDDKISDIKSKYPYTPVSHYLIEGNYIYEVPDWGWDNINKKLTDKYTRRLMSKNRTPAFFFPMDKVKAWSNKKSEEKDYRQGELFKQGKAGAPNPGMLYWIVEGIEDVKVTFGKIQSAYKLMYRTNGGPTTVWFKKDLGKIKETYQHSGSYFESTSILKKALLNN